MDHVIMVGCDLHDKTMLLKIAVGREKPETLSVKNTVAGRRELVALLRERARQANGAEVTFAYEASGQGFGLHDQLTDAGFSCVVLAPTLIARSSKQRRRKTDERDALQLLELLRGHVLAGNPLPKIWIPDSQTRDDRDLVRMRLEVAGKVTALKAQVQGLLKRNGRRRPSASGKGWSVGFRRWLVALTSEEGFLPPGARAALGSLLRQLEPLETEVEILDRQVLDLAMTDRYRDPFYELLRLKGVGTLTAMVFLTEMGDLRRFSNRRQIGAYLGLVPSSQESGDRSDRKGHITHQGPARVRKVLCQATWARVRTDEEEKAAYQRIAARNPKHKKIAVVASMRRLAVRMWHRAVDGLAATETTSARARQKGPPPSAFAVASAPEGLRPGG
jgi:transposase